MRLLIVFMALTASACTYGGNVATVASPASEIRTDRRIDQAVSVWIDPQLSLLEIEADTGYMCSAHAYPVNMGPAIEGSLRRVLEGSFSSYSMRNTPVYEGLDLDMRLSYDSARARLEFSAGFWQATAIATTELVMRVDVQKNGQPVTSRETIAGEGTQSVKGDCPMGAEAASEASRKAIKRTMENFVYKIVNSGAIVP